MKTDIKKLVYKHKEALIVGVIAGVVLGGVVLSCKGAKGGLVFAEEGTGEILFAAVQPLGRYSYTKVSDIASAAEEMRTLLSQE